jgi:hypothetical protein
MTDGASEDQSVTTTKLFGFPGFSPPVCVIVTTCPAMVTVPVRVRLGRLGSTVYTAVPLAVLLALLVTVIHDALLTVVQVHPDCVATFVVNVPPSPVTACAVGEREKVQAPATPLCATVRVLPATVRVPVRALVDVFEETV